MPSAERRALLLLLSLALAGQGVRWFVTRPGEAPGQVELLATLPARSPTAHRDSALALARPLEPGERIDADRATAVQLARLPRIGLALAKTIVAEREATGAFGSLEGLDRVAGIGPGLLRVMEPHLVFSGVAVTGCAAAACSLPQGPRSGLPAAPLDLNSASQSELDGLPGIGPARAKAIIELRERIGRFGSVDELGQVSGLGPAALSRLRDRVVVR
ncbi:MAG: helix-hairpin-helix domain-containing protein [Gemmatimonadales bacterium]|nr:helix-hairpin-helix domain-containing protein [Gemmatimonadales bacterium]